MKQLIMLLSYCLLVLLSCEERSINESLIGQWEFYSIMDKEGEIIEYYPDSLDRKVYIEFTDSNIVNLTGYCNIGSADYFVAGNDIVIKDANLSELVCFSVGGVWESYLLELNNVTSFKLEEGKLILLTNSEFDLHFSKIE